MSIYSKFFDTIPDVQGTLNDMINNVHTNMKTFAPPVTRMAVPAIPEAIAKIPVEPSARTKPVAKKPLRRMTGGQAPSVLRTMSIPQAKAKLERKSLLNSRRGLANVDEKGYSYQKRIHEVMQQKSVLESMLQEHRRLQRDRQNIAMDIQKMRNDLDKIRQKLDVSLQSLKSTQTIFGAALKTKKSLLASHPGSAPRRVTINAPKPKGKAQKGSVITQKRTHAMPKLRYQRRP